MYEQQAYLEQAVWSRMNIYVYVRVHEQLAVYHSIFSRRRFLTITYLIYFKYMLLHLMWASAVNAPYFHQFFVCTPETFRPPLRTRNSLCYVSFCWIQHLGTLCDELMKSLILWLREGWNSSVTVCSSEYLVQTETWTILQSGGVDINGNQFNSMSNSC